MVVAVKSLAVNPDNKLIRHLTDSNGRIKSLFAYFVDSEGEIGRIPFEISFDSFDSFDNLESFITTFKESYIIFRDENNNLLFEVSDGLLVYISEEVDIERKDIREVLYKAGMKNVC